MSTIKENTKEKGVAILFMILIMSIILSIGLGISAISIQQSRLMTAVGGSIVAFYAADTGVERELFDLYRRPEMALGDFVDTLPMRNLEYKVIAKYSNTHECHTNFDPEKCLSIGSDETCTASNFCVKSLGTFKKTKRAIEIKY